MQTQDDIDMISKQINKESEDYIDHAEHIGTVAGATQAAQQNYLQANAPDALEQGAQEVPNNAAAPKQNQK
jgi:hypothetical protein